MVRQESVNSKKITLFDKNLTLAELEREYILLQLEHYDYNLTETARAIGMV
jgi:ActR/RegA family two-component response regulator